MPAEEAVTHSINGRPVPSCGDQCSCPSLVAAPALASEAVMYANLVDAVKLLNAMIERTKYCCSAEEAELLWRLRFVTRIEP